MRNKRSLTAVQRWGAKALTLLLACALMAGLAVTASARGDWQGEVVDPAIPKPIVTIQGNLVTEKGKPTGFYELALCVQSGRTITDLTGEVDAVGSVISEADYADYIAAHPEAEGDATLFDIQYYPFRAATAAMNINTDILTAVNWNLVSVTYETYDATTGYPSDLTDPGKYPRGINTDPVVQGYAESGLLESDAFPDITTPNLYFGGHSVALDVEGDPRMFNAEGVVEHFENDTALLTLSAAAPDNHPVVLPQSTPLVVARFSYDLKRFNATKVNENLGTLYAQRNSITGDVGADGFWMGWDKTSGFGGATFNGKQALTWLGESTGSFDFSGSDELISYTQGDQAVWIHTGTNEGSVTDQETYFYYYLGAEEDQRDGSDTVLVNIGGVPTQVDNVTIPKTAGQKVLTEGTDLNDGTPPAGYTYFRNLLRLKDDTLVLKLVNEPTFKRPANANDNIILFYDWDDTLIGTLAVGKGDVRAEVEAYIEETLVHPDLRPGSAFMSDGSGNVDLDKVTSLQRDYTYRGKYAYTVGGDDDALGVADGKEYPLTNKLDYVFTKRVNTIITQEENGATVQYVHPYALNDPALDPDVNDNDAAEFPYVYGWAVVEDTRAFNGKKDAVGTKGDWKVMHDAAKLEDVWTTMGVGELSAVRPANALSTATVDLTAERFAPVFLKEADPPIWTDGTMGDEYAYTISGQNEYLRFADFSDITAELERYEGKNTLVVKAVYEPGDRLALGNHYTLTTEPAYTKFNSTAAANGGAYKVQLTVERAFNDGGIMVGTTRVRSPLIRQDTTVDVKWLTSENPKVDHDMENVSLAVATSRTETTYSQVDIDNGEEITFSLSLSARHNKINYQLTEAYNANYVAGTQRSNFNTDQLTMAPNKFAIDNYNYPLASDAKDTDDYYDCDFSTKEGSRGFVLFGTLGHFLEQATKFNRGEVTRTSYNGAVQYTNMTDANLRMDLTGKQPAYASNTTLQNAFLAAAAKCEAHRGDPAYDCWDENLDCARLTYHQAQWFLLDYQVNPGVDILTVAEAEDSAHKLLFCHYHISCSGGHVPVAPTTWAELVATLRQYNDADPGSDDQNNALADLEVMELSALENLTSLRSNANGRKYTNLATFINALLAADAQVKAVGLDASWVNLQYAILGGASTDADAIREEAQKQYFWYAGATSAPKVNDFSTLMKAALTARTPVTLKDGDTTFLPKSALTAATFPTGVAEYLTAASPTRGQRNAWVTLTDNLAPNHSETSQDPDGTPNSGDEYIEYVYGRFSGMEDFLDQFTAAYYDIYDAVYDAATMDEPEDNNAWWQAIQTKLLRDVDPTDDLGDYDGTGDYLFWWKGGNTPFRITNLSTLLECVRRMNNMADADAYVAALKEWNRITVAEIESTAISQSLRWKGTDATHPLYPYTAAQLAADEASQKAAILTQLNSVVSRWDAAVAANSGLSVNWERIQYLILNPGGLPANSIVNAQRVYYWWQNGNTDGTTVDLVANPVDYEIDLNVEALVQATYRAAFNDPGVNSSILAAATGGDGAKTFWNVTKLTTQRVLGTTFERHENDQYDGPDVETDVAAYAFPGNTEADVVALLDTLTAYRDLAKTEEEIADPYGMPIVNWQQVQYYLFNKTYISATSQTFNDLYTQDKALAGDYWWYYDTVRHPPDPPVAGEKNPEPSDPLAELLEKYLWGAPDGYADEAELKSSIDITAFNKLELYYTKTGSKYATTPAATKNKNQNTIRNNLVELGNLLKTSPYYENYYDATEKKLTLYWAQIQYWWVEGALLDNATALDKIVNEWGWSKADGSGSVKKIPADVDLSVLSSSASLTALNEIMQDDAAAAAPTLENLSDDELDAALQTLLAEKARREEAEQKEQASAEQSQTAERPAAVTRPSGSASVSTPVEPKPEIPVTPEPPAEDNAPVEIDPPALPEAPAEENTDERVEVPLGEEVRSTTRTPMVTEENGSVTADESTTRTPAAADEQTGSVTAERGATDITVRLVDRVYRPEPNDWKRRLGYAA